MKCPKCSYHSFDHLENCKKCGQDLSEHKAKFNLCGFYSSDQPEASTTAPVEEDIAAKPGTLISVLILWMKMTPLKKKRLQLPPPLQVSIWEQRMT